MGRIPSRQPRSVLLSGDSDSFPAGSAGGRICTRLCHPVAAVPQPRMVLKPRLHLWLPCLPPLSLSELLGTSPVRPPPPRTFPQDSQHVPDLPERPLLPLPRLRLLCLRVPNSHFWVLFMLALCLLSGQLDPWFLPALLRKQIRGRPGVLLPACGSTTQHSPQTQDSRGCLVVCEWGPTSPSLHLLVGSESLRHCQAGILRVTSSPSLSPPSLLPVSGACLELLPDFPPWPLPPTGPVSCVDDHDSPQTSHGPRPSPQDQLSETSEACGSLGKPDVLGVRHLLGSASHRGQLPS